MACLSVFIYASLPMAIMFLIGYLLDKHFSLDVRTYDIVTRYAVMPLLSFCPCIVIFHLMSRLFPRHLPEFSACPACWDGCSRKFSRKRVPSGILFPHLCFPIQSLPGSFFLFWCFPMYRILPVWETLKPLLSPSSLWRPSFFSHP